MEQGDLENYIGQLTNQIVSNPRSRSYTTISNTTEAIASIFKFLDNQSQELFAETAGIIANRLLQVEVRTQEKYKQITELQKGSLIQSYSLGQEGNKYLIAKVEHNAFIDALDLVMHVGLPFEKHVLKYCLIHISHDNEIVYIDIDDTNPKVSHYWWDTFLELRQQNSNEHNTNKAFSTIDQVFSRNLKENSPVDYTFLRNNLVGYFRTHNEFFLEDMIETVIGGYQLEKPEGVNIEKIKESIRKLPETKKFDGRFEITPINKRIKRIVPATDKIDITIKDHIEAIKHDIKSVEFNGDKYIQIRTDNDKAYQMFKYI